MKTLITPHAEVVDELRNPQFHSFKEIPPLLNKAATLISSQAEEIDRLSSIINECIAAVEPVDPNDTKAVFAGSLPEAVRQTAARAEAAESSLSSMTERCKELEKALSMREVRNVADD